MSDRVKDAAEAIEKVLRGECDQTKRRVDNLEQVLRPFIKPELDIKSAVKEILALGPSLLMIGIGGYVEKRVHDILSKYTTQSKPELDIGECAFQLGYPVNTFVGENYDVEGITVEQIRELAKVFEPVLSRYFKQSQEDKARIAELEKYIGMMGNAAECPMDLTESERFAEILVLRRTALKEGAK